jgi:RNA recognition motif-containing protein
MTDTSRWKSTIYIGGLPPQVTTQILSEAFLPFGEIVEISLPKNDGRNNNNRQNQNPNYDNPAPDSAVVDSQHRGYAYVEFEDPEDAKEAIDNMDQSELFGRVIKVSAAKIPKSATANQGLGSKTAVWEQVSSFPILFFFLKKKEKEKEKKTSPGEKDANALKNRKGGWPKMQLVRRIDWFPSRH